MRLCTLCRKRKHITVPLSPAARRLPAPIVSTLTSTLCTGRPAITVNIAQRSSRHLAVWHTTQQGGIPVTGLWFVNNVEKVSNDCFSVLAVRFSLNNYFVGIASALHLEAHMRMHRSTHICTVCSKKFLSASHLEKHRVTHTSERPFMCGTCGKTFRDPYR